MHRFIPCLVACVLTFLPSQSLPWDEDEDEPRSRSRSRYRRNLDDDELDDEDESHEERFQPKRRMITFATHHKTGTHLAVSTSHCWKRNGGFGGNINVDAHWGKEGIEPPRKGVEHTYVHFMRDLSELVVSGYLYHKQTIESWATKPRNVNFTSFAYTKEAVESYQDYLNRVSAEEGIHAEYMRFLHGSEKMDSEDGGIAEMAHALGYCQANSQSCMTVCLPDFQKDYRGTWKTILGFLRLGADPECLAMGNQDAGGFYDDKHVTKNKVSEAERERLYSFVQQIDQDKGNGNLKALSQMNPCTKKASMVEAAEGVEL
eukprot:gnl/TRDRNA2_/TRDRNA2_93694_c0_seq2.p1 gnl/TRDRNA2_/TRDRNA2_93694_c0~~gnl/TRDRNA2_/TRDRNA2_93694_c0_seq2.p1  ORF type:complete len:317 (+),score=43.29 gnl/TRDRNA2_/TRDRNA2_93694_c0_seq2:44-994(+)